LRCVRLYVSKHAHIDPSASFNYLKDWRIGMKRISLIFAALTIVIASNAAAQDVKYNFDKNTDFSKFKTYKWVSLKDAAPVNGLLDKQIKATVDAQLATKGLSKVDGDDANLFIDYQVGMTTEKQFTSFSNDFGGGAAWGPGPGWGRGGWYGPAGMGGGMTTGNTSTIYIGQLALDMNDAANHDLVWRGVASKTIDPNAKPDKQQKDLTNSVAKLLKNYPPKTK
jgi:hypothetical protein